MCVEEECTVGPRPYWALGNLADFVRKGTHRVFNDWNAQYGSIYVVGLHLILLSDCAPSTTYLEALLRVSLLFSNPVVIIDPVQVMFGPKPIVVVNEPEVAR